MSWDTSRPNKRAALILVLAVMLAHPRTANAYRPFDTTDATVTGPGELVVELGPVGFLDVSDERYLTAPSVILNLGVFHNLELVLQGRNFVLLNNVQGVPRDRFVDTGLFLKTIIREGSLQNGSGPSLGLELGPLLPTLNAESGFGATAIAIVSQRWSFGTVHLNAVGTLTRAHDAEVFGGLIIEGPYAWPVRPVAEVFVDRDFGGTLVYSALAGAIWRVSSDLSLDAALRLASVNETSAFELRAGLTWTIPLWASP